MMAETTRDHSRLRIPAAVALLTGALVTAAAQGSGLGDASSAPTPLKAHPASANTAEDWQQAERDLRRRLIDAWIDASVRQELSSDTRIEALDIDVKTHRGIVRLTGEVGSEGERDRVVAVAIRTPGVYGVNDTHLKVKGS
jgi:osmotically-inducible protein OsmY